jgi:hypothetical protein
VNARSSSRASHRSPPIPWSAARGALAGASGSRRRSPKGHRRCAAPPCQCHVSTHDERAHAGGDHGPRVNGGPRDGLLAIRSQAVTYLRSRPPSRARASTFCVVDQCGYGDNRTALRRTRLGGLMFQLNQRVTVDLSGLSSRASRSARTWDDPAADVTALPSTRSSSCSASRASSG